MKWWDADIEHEQGLDAWRNSVRLACNWVIDISMIKTRQLELESSSFEHIHGYSDWRGAFKGEYNASTCKWDVFCPIWHGGQGVKALALAYSVLNEEAYLQAARAAADFILRSQVSDEKDPDFGHILAYEGGSEGVNTSAIFESLDGLFTISEVSGDEKYADAAIKALCCNSLA